MAIENEIHPIQVNTLMVLLFRTNARFSELNTMKIPSDQFNFHLKELIKASLIEKHGELYHLTAMGKEFANKFDTNKSKIEKQSKVTVAVFCIRRTSDENEYLVQKRLKQPYYGFYGGITGKVTWGETIKEAAIRELMEETNLSGKPILVGLEHKMDYEKMNGSLLEDKLFFVFRVNEPEGKLKRKFKGGENIWLNENEITKLPDKFDDIDLLLKMLRNNSISFIERKYKVKQY